MLNTMENNISFGGMTLQSGNVHKFAEKFDVEYDDGGQFIAVSKETFHHEDDDDLCFDYKYVIEIIDMKAFDNDNHVHATLMLMPTPNSLCPAVQSQMMDFCGCDMESIGYMDLISYGGSDVIMGHESWEDDEEVYPMEDEKCQQVLDSISTLFESINRMRGFYIDRTWNMIGSTGWDTLRHAVLGEELFPMLRK